MSYQWDGVDDQMVYGSAPAAINVTGTHTLLVVVRELATSEAVWQSYIETETSAAGASATLGRDNSGTIYWAQGSTDHNQVAFGDSDNWAVVAARKNSAGTGSCTNSKCVFGGADTHTSDGGSGFIAASSITGGTIRLGGNDDFANIRLAAAAIFTRALTDGEINGVKSAATTQSIFDLTPVWLVDANDGFVTDYMANCSRTSVTGTATNADNPASWVYGLAGAVTVPWLTMAPPIPA